MADVLLYYSTCLLIFNLLNVCILTSSIIADRILSRTVRCPTAISCIIIVYIGQGLYRESLRDGRIPELP
jgi:hypothetical protein